MVFDDSLPPFPIFFSWIRLVWPIFFFVMIRSRWNPMKEFYQGVGRRRGHDVRVHHSLVPPLPCRSVGRLGTRPVPTPIFRLAHGSLSRIQTPNPMYEHRLSYIERTHAHLPIPRFHTQYTHHEVRRSTPFLSHNDSRIRLPIPDIFKSKSIVTYSA